jgi:hypothetical protein
VTPRLKPGGGRRARPALPACAASVLALALAACGGGRPSASQVAHLGPSSTTRPSTFGPPSALAYAKCMRANGVPNFPSPDAQGQTVVPGGQGGVPDPASPLFQHAAGVCQKYRPQGGLSSPAQETKMVAQALKFAKCMRAHGLPNFPDPDVGPAGPGFYIRLGGPGSGVDPQSPRFQAAQGACQKLLPGKPEGPGS